jgi:Domain of unknown function (DUF4261)
MQNAKSAGSGDDALETARCSVDLFTEAAGFPREPFADSLRHRDPSLSITTESSDAVRIEGGGGAWSVTSSIAPFDLESLAPSLEQSWQWRGAGEVLARSVGYVRMVENEPPEGDYKERLRLFRAVIAAVLDTGTVTAIHWTTAQHFVDPAEFLETIDADDLLFGALNVRLFRLDPPDHGVFTEQEEYVMDTLGLTTLGLPDLQLHFRMLDRGRVAQFLHHTAYYIFDNGEIIAPGHRIEGIAPGTEWLCRAETSLLAPPRRVIDLDPGPPYSAARRVS